MWFTVSMGFSHFRLLKLFFFVFSPLSFLTIMHFLGIFMCLLATFRQFLVFFYNFLVLLDHFLVILAISRHFLAKSCILCRLVPVSWFKTLTAMSWHLHNALWLMTAWTPWWTQAVYPSSSWCYDVWPQVGWISVKSGHEPAYWWICTESILPWPGHGWSWLFSTRMSFVCQPHGIDLPYLTLFYFNFIGFTLKHFS